MIVTDGKPDPGSGCVSPCDYIRNNFESHDRIAVLVRSARRGETLQRISTAEKIASEPFQDWMRFKNHTDACDVYIGMNALKANAFTRTKHDIQAVRHLYADFDHDGSMSLAALEKSTLVPPPNYVLNTSPDKFQAVWKVEEIEITRAEAYLHALASEFDGDFAATDAARVLRVPGFLNRKYEEEFLVSAKHLTNQIYQARDFKLKIESPESGYRHPRPSSRVASSIGPRHFSQSERDWAYVKDALTHGADPEDLITELARSRATDKSNPQYYARLTVTKALSDLGMHAPPLSESRD